MRTDLLQGTLDLLVLKVLSAGPNHGWGIAQLIEERSGEVFLVNQGSLYPSLHRLEREGVIRAEWGASENNRRARIYEITALGRKRLEEETASWERVTLGMGRVLGST
jgi:PadR family transcriptional regulator, regulatory protein PadR